MFQEPYIAIPLGSERQYYREVICGIARYARQHTTWLLESEPTSVGRGSLRSHLKAADGAVLLLQTEEQLRWLRRKQLPFVNLGSLFAREDIPTVNNDPTAIARLGFEHFRERGFEHFAFCDLDENSYLRREPFEEVVRAAGYDCHVYRVDFRQREAWRAGRDHRRLDRWLAGLPKPVGIMAHNDVRGRHLSNACRRLELAVPDEVAILGVDNELPHCDLCNPPLSSIATDAARVGYEAARLLHQLLSGETPHRRCIKIPPTRIVVRQSSDVQATEDQLVSRAVRFIRERACHGIRVHDVQHQLRISRTALDQRFRAALGHTPHEEIVRVRLRRARQLLTDTDLTLETIAARTGFRHGEYLGAVFLKHYNQTPGEYRSAAGRR